MRKKVLKYNDYKKTNEGIKDVLVGGAMAAGSLLPSTGYSSTPPPTPTEYTDTTKIGWRADWGKKAIAKLVPDLIGTDVCRFSGHIGQEYMDFSGRVLTLKVKGSEKIYKFRVVDNRQFPPASGMTTIEFGKDVFKLFGIEEGREFSWVEYKLSDAPQAQSKPQAQKPTPKPVDKEEKPVSMATDNPLDLKALMSRPFQKAHVDNGVGPINYGIQLASFSDYKGALTFAAECGLEQRKIYIMQSDDRYKVCYESLPVVADADALLNKLNRKFKGAYVIRHRIPKNLLMMSQAQVQAQIQAQTQAQVETPRPTPTRPSTPSTPSYLDVTPSKVSNQRTMYTIQVGSFDDKKNALDFFNRIQDSGFRIFNDTTTNRYKVVYGEYNDKETAKSDLSGVKNQFPDAFLTTYMGASVQAQTKPQTKPTPVTAEPIQRPTQSNQLNNPMELGNDGYVIQVASYFNKKYADNKLSQMSSIPGIKVAVGKDDKGEATYRLVVGDFKTKTEAGEYLNYLLSNGYIEEGVVKPKNKTYN